MVNRSRLIKLTQQLIRIDSQNPPGDEAEIARFVAGYLKRLGLRVNLYEFKKRRANVVAYLAGGDKRHSLLITPHLDTVPAGKSWKRKPLAAVIEGGRIYGLGATDCKGNLACAIEAINGIVEEKHNLEYNLIFAATADEECGSKMGLVPLLEKGIVAPDAALVLDADEFDIVVAQKGLAHLKIKVQGRRAHGAYPEKGINAIDIAIDLIKEIKSHKFKYAKNKYLKSPTVNIGTIKGGDKVNIVADWCEFEVDLRFLPGMPEKNILRRIEEILDKHAGRSRIEIEDIQRPYSISPRHPLVAGLKKAAGLFGARPQVKGSEGATVITFFQKRNIPAVACGFGSRNCAHMSDEYANIGNLYKGARALEFFLKDYFFN